MNDENSAIKNDNKLEIRRLKFGCFMQLVLAANNHEAYEL